MKKILNKSKAGKGAQDFLKNKQKSETKKFDKEQEILKKEEKRPYSSKKSNFPENTKKLNGLGKINLKSRSLTTFFEKKNASSIRQCIKTRT